MPLDGNSPLRPSRLSTLTPLSHICLDCAHCQGSPSAPTSARLLGPAPPASSSKFSLLSATLQNLTAWEPWDPPFSKEATKPVSNPRSTWVDQNPGPWVSPSYNGVIFSSPWPRHAPWLAAVGYLPLPRAATASRSQPSNGPRLPSPGRQGQGAGVQEAAQPPPLLPV